MHVENLGDATYPTVPYNNTTNNNRAHGCRSTAHHYIHHNSKTYGDVWVRVGSSSVPDEHGVALAVVARTHGSGLHLHKASVCVAAAPSRNALAYDSATGIFADVHHLGARIRLLPIVCEGDRVKFPDAVVPLEHD